MNIPDEVKEEINQIMSRPPPKLHEYAVTLNNDEVEVYFCHEFKVIGSDIYFSIWGNTEGPLRDFKNIKNLTAYIHEDCSRLEIKCICKKCSEGK